MTIPTFYDTPLEDSVYIFPTSFAQQRLCFLDQLEPNSAAYNIPSIIRLSGLLNVSALERSLNAIIERHEVLRTTFRLLEEQPMQVVIPALTVPLPLVDLQNLPKAEWEAETLRLATEEAQRPFNLAQGPLVRTALLQLEAEEHALLLTMHHIISDGWSMVVFLQELAALYEDFSASRPSSLSELPIQYVDFTIWQREWLQGRVLEQQMAYWKQQLEGASANLELPTDHPRPLVQTNRGSMYLFTLSRQQTDALKSLSRQEDVTLYMTLVAMFNTLLYRYTGKDDILIGSPTAGRVRVETEDLIGFFVNTLVLRTDLSGDPTFRQLLRRVREVSLEAQAYQNIPFEYLVKELQPERYLGQNPLFQVMLTLEPSLPALPSGWSQTYMEIDTGTSKFDLSLTFEDRPEGLIGRFEYSTDLFDAATIERMAGHWQTLMKGVVDDPEQRLAELSILTDEEQHQLLFEWNTSSTTFPNDQYVHQLFEAQVERTPNAVALVLDEQQLTYQQLNSRANQLAHLLQRLGVGPEVLVGICVERSVEMVVGLLAVLKAGGAFVPLDPTYPQDQLAFLLGDSQVAVLLTQQRVLGRLPAHSIPMICLDTDWQVIAQEGSDNPHSEVTSDQLAYVIYTSGSTGKPKGVLIPHRAIALHCWSIISCYELSAKDRVLQFSVFTFDAALEQILPTLLTGASVILRGSEVWSASELWEKIIGYGLTVVNLPTAYWSHITQEWIKMSELIGPHPLRLVIVGGDRMVTQQVEHWHHLPMDAVRLLNAYGPTETTITATLFEVSSRWSAQSSSQTIPIGRTLPHRTSYILDSAVHPVPIGVVGELYIGGDVLARGYLNRAELTAEKFIADPFSSEPNARLYRTGDLARYLPDGTIEFLGRLDHQVKIRGFRIELGEIETVLSQHPDVRETVVVAHEDSPGEKRLVAYVVLGEKQTSTLSDLRGYVMKALPAYMVPSAFVLLEAVPLMPNGKIDRRTLPAPDANRLELEENFVAPRTAVEEVLANIWAQVLRLDHVGIHDNFFELGGDSILSIQIISRAHQAGLPLTPKNLFQYQTIAQLASVITPAHAVEAQQEVVTGAVTLTPIQHWFFEQHFVAPDHWNQAWMLEVNQVLDTALLEQALQHLLAHHDALRLRFHREERSWQQVHVEHEEAEVFRQIDLSSVSAAEQSVVLEAIADEAQASLHLATGPLLRCVYFEMGSKQAARLLIVIHHLVVDGVSWRILLEDLTTAYQQFRQGNALHLPAKTTSFQQWAQRLTKYAQSAGLRQEMPYWLNISRTSISTLPVDYTNGLEANTMASARTVEVSLSVEETHALLHLVPKAYHTQINDVLLTALVQAFATWTGESMLLVDLEGHGRESLDEDVNLVRTVGWFTSVFPVCLALHDSSPGEVLKAVKEQLRHIPNHGIGYGVLRYMGGQEDIERLKALPQAQVSFNYLGQFDSMVSETALFKLAGESTGPTRTLQETRSYLLEIESLIIDGRLQVSWLYNEHIHQRSTIERIAEYYLEALHTLIAHCQSPEVGGYTPSDFPLAKLNEQELYTLLTTVRTDEESSGIAFQRSGRNLEDIYPLSPLQQGMLFHSRYAPGSGVYIIQAHYALHGDLHVSAFKRAWQVVVDRYAIFRTTFVWEGLKEPMQVVQQQTTVSWEEQDWRGLLSDEQDERMAHYLKVDRTQDFDLVHGPLMRFSLIRTTENSYHFTWSHHHLLLDGWSWPLVLQDVFVYYEAFRQGQELHLPQAPFYRDYIAWLQHQDQDASERFWRQALEGFSSTTSLPFDSAPVGKGSTQIGSKEYKEQHIQLAETTTAALRKLASRQQLTLNTLLQGVWAVLLSRYSGEHDVLFGATTSGRPVALPRVEFMVGPCINTLPVRVRVPSDALLLPWLKELQTQQIEARQYEYSSLVQIQGWSEVPRMQSLFESLFVFENYPIGFSSQEERGEVKLNTIQSTEQTNYPLVVVVVAGREQSIQIQYDCSRFEPTTITRMAGHLQTILESIADNPDQRLHELPLLTPTERQQLLVEWNAPSTPSSTEQCVHQLFEAQVERTPNAVALVLDEQQLTYQQLNSRANQLAHYLQRVGVGPDVLVGVCVERSVEMVVGLLAVLKAGGAFVPLDPTYPQDQLAFLLGDSQVAVLLTQQRVLGRLPEHSTPMICLDTDWQVIAQEGSDNPHSEVTSGQLAYVIYTSGSTGKPKGVLIPHEAIALHCHSIINYYELTAKDCVLQFSVFTFDAALEQILPTLLAGASVILRGPEVWSAMELQQKIAAFGLTVMNLPTAYWHHVTEAWATTSNERLSQQLRLVIVGGDRVLPQYVELWQQLPMQEVRLLNAYGPTETIITATLFEIARRSDNKRSVKSIPIGRPLAHRTSYILDAYGHPVPIGVVGELYIGGDVLARGYLNRAELTAEKFIADPFSSEPNARLYRTGDMARYLPNGNIEFIGRIDQQVKIRGFRIELGEIESVLGRHPGLRQSMVVVREDSPGNKRLVAYFVQDARQHFTDDEVRHFVKEKLPDYMVPSAFVLLDAFPLLPNGKVDRHALPVPDQVRLALEETLVAPTSMLHHQLIQIWEELLDVRPIGIRDNFFYLGGHSLLAARLVNRIGQVCGRKISLAALFAAPTIEQLAHALQTEEEKCSRTPVVAVQVSGSKRPFFYLHGAWHSEAFYCFQLARHLGPDQPFYALEPYHFDGLRAAPSVEDMAAAHIQSIRTIQPEGPYLLGGFCNGGLVAYEMARQLQGQGQRVDLLVLIDPAEHFDLHRLVRHVISRVGNLLRLSQEKQLECFLRMRHMYKYVRNQRRVKDLKAFDVIDPSIQTLYPTADALRQDNLAIWNWIVAGCSYRLYPGRTTLFWAREELFDGLWRQKAAREEMELHVIPGTHLGCLTDHVQALAEELRKCLCKAQVAELKESENSENIPISVGED